MVRKKGLITALLVSIFLVSAISVSAQGSLFKGFPTVHLKWNEEEISDPSGTPAVIIDNRTMIPVYLFKEMGISAVKKGNTVEMSNSKNEYFISLDALQAFNEGTIQVIDQINTDILSLWKSVQNGTLTDSAIQSLKEQLNRVIDNSKGSGKLVYLKTGLHDNPSNIYRAADVCQYYLKAMDHLENYQRTSKETELAEFFKEVGHANSQLDLIKSDYNQMMKSTLERMRR
ncbi:hypothetical protein [Paenibacillus sp. FSL W8-0194]|uniref:hypothetical protein n=1 Tax=Paenibacillus sp. FSL W8-0194 TaxID=2921711 RepID=UPI0030DAA806